jgi:hypothetical protein
MEVSWTNIFIDTYVYNRQMSERLLFNTKWAIIF